MKRTLILSVTAACAAAATLRGDGVEEVGDWQEHYPAEDYGLNIDRRLVEDGDETVEVTQIIEDYFDEWPDLDVVGNVVEENHMEDWHEDYEGPDVPLEEDEKEYSPDSEATPLIEAEVDIMGEAIADQRDRREAACGQGQTEFKIVCKTDNYGYEFSWMLKKSTGSLVAKGPPSGTNYADNSVYSGRWCLAPADYNFQVRDKAGDGLCSNRKYGCGYCKTFLDGQPNGSAQDESKWAVKNIPVKVNPFSSRIDGANNGNGNNNNGQWCNKVRSKAQLPRGTCTLPNGQRGHRVRVNVRTDKYGKETSWSITRSGQVRMKLGPVIAANSQKTVEDCLPPGDYKWTINDLDGICCRHGEGSYTLTVDGKKLLDGGSFSKTQSYDFKLGYDWVNDMSERDCEWWWAHDYRRRDWHGRCYPGFYCNKSYVQLKWSKSLARDAKIYAQELLGTCDSTGIKHDNTDQGENLAKNKGSGEWGRLYTADKVTKRFVDNEEHWGWNRNAHLTQAMWRASKYIGCAESVKSMGNGRMCRMQVCRYAKAGNCMMGKYDSANGNKWMIPTMMDDSPCGPMCPPDQGCLA